MSLLKAADISAAFFEKSSHEKPGANYRFVKQPSFWMVNYPAPKGTGFYGSVL